ncbi:four helix bundle protein [candidate division WOR-3 bacterium]|nr:four helix bundle protein [candidate division WOR-3 bacterium]
MSNIEKFEDIEAWKKARELAKKTYYLIESGVFAKDWSLKDQVRRASISIMSNIAEGYGRRTDKEFTQFLYIALGSVFESQSQLYLACDLSYINEAEFNDIYSKSEEVKKLIGGFIKYLRKNN